MLVKICGIRTKKDLLSAIKAGADETGFVVGVPESKRNVSFAKARELLAIETGKPKIAVTVAKNAADVERLISEVEPDRLQVHGKISKKEWEKILGLCRKKKIGVIRAVKAGRKAKREIEDCKVGTVLLDSATVGGTGKKADWKRCARIVERFPHKKIKLSGGLTPANVQEAIRIVGPWAVDVSSGVEEKGRKSARKMREFVEAAR